MKVWLQGPAFLYSLLLMATLGLWGVESTQDALPNQGSQDTLLVSIICTNRTQSPEVHSGNYTPVHTVNTTCPQCRGCCDYNSEPMTFPTEAKGDTCLGQSPGMRYTWLFTQGHNKCMTSSFCPSGFLLSLSELSSTFPQQGTLGESR